MKNERLIEEFLAGFNDVLMLVAEADKCGSWEKAMEGFDWSDRDMNDCAINKHNLEVVRKILERKCK